MIQKLKQWWAAHPISMHAIVGVIGTITLLYESVPAVKQLFNNLYGHMPGWSHQVVAALIGIYAFYYKSGNQKPPAS